MRWIMKITIEMFNIEMNYYPYILFIIIIIILIIRV